MTSCLSERSGSPLCGPTYLNPNSSRLSEPEFKAYPKTTRLDDETVTISEKIDGTNGVIYVHRGHLTDVLSGADSNYVLAGSRSRWLKDDGTKNWDNHGFGAWVRENEEKLRLLPEGFHYGEWYGRGINRGYGLKDRKFMLFNRERYINLPIWEDMPPELETETVIQHDVSLSELYRTISGIKAAMNTLGSRHVARWYEVEGLICRFKKSAKVFKVVWNK